MFGRLIIHLLLLVASLQVLKSVVLKIGISSTSHFAVCWVHAPCLQQLEDLRHCTPHSKRAWCCCWTDAKKISPHLLMMSSTKYLDTSSSKSCPANWGMCVSPKKKLPAHLKGAELMVPTCSAHDTHGPASLPNLLHPTAHVFWQPGYFHTSGTAPMENCYWEMIPGWIVSGDISPSIVGIYVGRRSSSAQHPSRIQTMLVGQWRSL